MDWFPSTSKRAEIKNLIIKMSQFYNVDQSEIYFHSQKDTVKYYKNFHF